MHVLIFEMFSDLCCERLCCDFIFDCKIAVPSCLLYLFFVSQLSLSVPFSFQLLLNFHYLYHLVSSCGLICNGKSEMYVKVFESNYNYN